MVKRISSLQLINYLLLTLILPHCSKNEPDIPLTNKLKNHEIQFTDVSIKAGLGGFLHDNGSFGEMLFPEQMGSGGGFVDFNGDRWLDILLLGGGGWKNKTLKDTKGIQLYKNNQDGTFSDVTSKLGLVIENIYTLGVVAADYDNDGDQDIFITTMENNILFRNDGELFTDVSKSSGLGNVSEWSSSPIFFDADRDGLLDLYVCNYAVWSYENDLDCAIDRNTKVYCSPERYEGLPSRFYHNNGDGTFTDYTKQAGFLPAPGKSLGVVQIDFNNDNWPDLAVANDGERDLLYENNGDGTFTERGTVLGMAYGENGEARAGMGIDAGVVNSSGNTSIFVGNFSSEMIGVYHYTSKGWFNDQSALSRIGRASYFALTFGLFLFDVDLDMDLDLFVGNGHVYPTRTKSQDGVSYKQESQLFLNNDGKGVFTYANELVAGALKQKMVVRGASAGDYDRDGDVDILLTENNGPAHLWRNDVNDKNYLQIFVEGTKSNKDGLGTKINLHIGENKLERTIRTGSSYLSQSELSVTFGLGTYAVVDSITVLWPSGIKDVLYNIVNNQQITIRESNS
tara:strand:- start:3016 stop:4719 length:1704 start_codon:yes stop_codon:yes gene_type:complete